MSEALINHTFAIYARNFMRRLQTGVVVDLIILTLEKSLNEAQFRLTMSEDLQLSALFFFFLMLRFSSHPNIGLGSDSM